MWGKRDDMIVHEHDPYNAESPRGALADTITDVHSFYVRNHGAVPDRASGTWRIKVDGLVDTVLDLDLAELTQRWVEHTVVATMQCAGNRRIGFFEVRDIPGESPWGPGATSTAEWTGVRLADVLAAAGVRDEAAHVEFTAPDLAEDATPPQCYGSSISLAKATAPETLLAWAMNGAPLPAVHGGPLRVVVPGYIGARSVKWVDRISVRTEPSENYFQANAYRLLPADADATSDGMQLSAVALNCDFVTHADGAHVGVGAVEVAGYAYAGDDRSVVRVDVSADDGVTWQQADVDPPSSEWAWQHWRAVLDVAPGDQVLVARAWDSSGACQPESPAHLWNPKGYINNSWARIKVQAS